MIVAITPAFVPIPKNRRIANRNNMEAPNIRSGNSSGKRGSRLSDVTYGALFAPMPDEEESNQKGRNISFADLTNLKIDNVADIPIRRDVVDNLMNKNNNSCKQAQSLIRHRNEMNTNVSLHAETHLHQLKDIYIWPII